MDPRQQYCLRWNNHHANMLTVFEELLQNECFTDVTLACEGTSIKCHKMVLAAGSTYFASLFVENACQHPIVVLKDIRYAEIKAILEYMYRGEVNVQEDQLGSLIRVADALRVKGLVHDRPPNTSPSIPPHKQASPSPRSRQPSPSSRSRQHSPPPPRGNDLSPPDAPPHPIRTKVPSHRTSPYPQAVKPQVMHPTTLAIPPWPTQAIAAMAHSPLLNPSRYRLSPHEAAPITGISSHPRPVIRTKNDTPILRTALGHGQTDGGLDLSVANMATLSALTGGTVAANNNSNGPGVDSDKEVQGSDEVNTPIRLDKKVSGSGQNYMNQKPEWKRYKQYTPTDVNDAIAAVKKGVSPLRASREFGVPSRTLYDKVKKLGIVTSRHHRRGAFPVNLKVELVNQEGQPINLCPDDNQQGYALLSSGEDHTAESNNGSDEALNMHIQPPLHHHTMEEGNNVGPHIISPREASSYHHASEESTTGPNTISPPSPHSRSFSGDADDENDDKEHKLDADDCENEHKNDVLHPVLKLEVGNNEKD